MEINVKAVELRELWRRYKVDGEENARERLVVAYSPLVKFIAGRMAWNISTHGETIIHAPSTASLHSSQARGISAAPSAAAMSRTPTITMFAAAIL